MFLEPFFKGQRNGWIEIICGSMFSGKTEELIRRLKRAKIARQKVQIFKPANDTRYDMEKVVSHDENYIVSIPVEQAQDILNRLEEEVNVVGIDEAQFFDANLPEICEELANRGIRVIAAGLDMDYRGVPFEPIPQLLAMAEYITKTQAICVVCGNPATFTYRTSKDAGRVVVGATNIYEARCRNCYVKPETVKNTEKEK